jgi:hypothetical protein
MTEWEKFERMVSLKSEVVELGLNEDMRAAIKAAKDARVKVEDTKKTVRQAIDKLKAEYKDLQTKALEAGVKIEQFQKTAKELGLDSPADIKNELGLMRDHQKLGNAKQGELTKITL